MGRLCSISSHSNTQNVNDMAAVLMVPPRLSSDLVI